MYQPQEREARANASNLPAIANEQPPVVKEKRVSKRIQQGIAVIVSGEVKTLKDAAEKAGMSYWHFVRELKKPHIRVFAEHEARKNLTHGTMRASARLVELIDASSEHVSFDASRHVLGIAGIKPAADPQVSVNIDIKAGYVIDISEGERPMQTVNSLPKGTLTIENTNE